MTWYKEFLSENRKDKQNSVSTLDDLFDLIGEVYETRNGKSPQGARLTETIPASGAPGASPETTLTLKALPEIAVSELGWTDVSGRGAQEVSGPERQRLHQFLKNISGGDFVEKVSSLSSFYQDPDAAMSSMCPAGKATSTAAPIKMALSYMVFFKTLTKVISNFNAASAGFNFEAFLAVLA